MQSSWTRAAIPRRWPRAIIPHGKISGQMGLDLFRRLHSGQSRADRGWFDIWDSWGKTGKQAKLVRGDMASFGQTRRLRCWSARPVHPWPLSFI